MKLLKFTFLIFFLPSLFLCCNNQPSGKNSEVSNPDSQAVSADQDHRQQNDSTNHDHMQQNDSIKIVVNTFLANKGWGYDIILNEKLYIHQPNIPSISGNNGFKTKEDAIRTGEFVAYEIRNHILPP